MAVYRTSEVSVSKHDN